MACPRTHKHSAGDGSRIACDRARRKEGMQPATVMLQSLEAIFGERERFAIDLPAARKNRRLKCIGSRAWIGSTRDLEPSGIDRWGSHGDASVWRCVQGRAGLPCERRACFGRRTRPQALMSRLGISTGVCGSPLFIASSERGPA